MRKTGFSLVELLVVMGIITTLTAILLPNFMGARERAKDAQKIQDMNSLKNALRMYYNDHQAYPPQLGVGTSLGSEMYQYMPGLQNLGYGYTYYQPTGDQSFILYIGLESDKGDDDLDSQRKCGITSPVNGVFAVCAR